MLISPLGDQDRILHAVNIVIQDFGVYEHR